MLLGYARISGGETPDTQINDLRAAGCRRVVVDENFNGGTSRRPKLDEALTVLKRGDALVVWKLDRVGRSLSHLLEVIQDLGRRGVGFRSICESIDTSVNPQGAFTLQLVESLVEFERSLIAERTRAGISAAKRRGARLGRRPKLSPDQIAHAKQLIDAGDSPSRVAKIIGVSPATLYRAIPAGASNRSMTPDLFNGVNA